MGSNDPDTSVPSEFEDVRKSRAEAQTETSAEWTSPDERRRSHRERAVGSFTKLLEHDPDTGLLTPDGVEQYETLVNGITHNDGSKLDAVERPDSDRKWISPRSSNAGSMKGAHPSVVGDAHGDGEMLAPWGVDSAELVVEQVEAYLFAACRDVAFREYGTGEHTDDADAFDAIDSHGSITRWAADRLNDVLAVVADSEDRYDTPVEVAETLQIPTADTGGVTPGTLFRGYSRVADPDGPDDTTGQYHSQFLLQRLYPLFPSGCAPYVAGLTGVTDLDLDAIALERHVPIANRREFGVTVDDYVAIRNGAIPEEFVEDDFVADAGRYPYIGRDMGTHVHTDGPYQEYYRAATVLLFWDFPRASTSPYVGGSPNEADGVTFGPVDPFAIVGAVAYEAFKAAWAQKWRSFRRLRPEAVGGLVDLEQRRAQTPLGDAVLHDAVESDPVQDVLDVVKEHNRRQAEQGFVDAASDAETMLLGQMYPEGSPTHPAYPSGHATMAGAGVTVLKALFDDDTRIATDGVGMRPVAIDPDDPTSHVFVDRGDHFDPAVADQTVGSELDKLASNIAHARMFGGVHFRSDGERGIRLGEQVAIRFLQDHLREYPEGEFGSRFEFTNRDGNRVTVTAHSIDINAP
ncbi:vanadium-dependent haloperoxidase [Halobellus salinus]|uniref:Vanadium-dependent haloperoxidase n=1 Tax=Halobellus salinus TaxID=931585 RepID=A0A830EBE3_9EURY|nr:vanadium-dependent haloperoxidase [Halobellus salinus]GGJ08673.1 vanadium-dependent haloperoxidase [Halobellus salinus]SMP28423.1 hypothetical protein SAMN06265347_11389 [Halobellus salinus]